MGKMVAMADTHILLNALKSIAYDKDERDVLQSLEEIREELAGDTTDTLPLTGKRSGMKDWTIRSAAHGLFASASKIARSKRKDKKRAIMRVAASYMGQHKGDGSSDRNLECLFTVRAIWKRGRPALELAGPVNARPRFLVGYAFWLVAKSKPASVWRRTERKQCPVCSRMFPDGGPGRPKKYCSHECYIEAHARMDKRRKSK
jgi:hypothetical protein